MGHDPWSHFHWNLMEEIDRIQKEIKGISPEQNQSIQIFN
jgi:hypothetical protein